METEKTLKEKRKELFDEIDKLLYSKCSDIDCRVNLIRRVKEIICDRDEQFINELLEETKDYPFSMYAEEIRNKIKQKAGFEK